MTLKYKNIVVLTGAGISADSGISTFRGQDGLWENHRIQDVASPEGFAENPELVLSFYNLRREQLLDSELKPNPGHYALAEVELACLAAGGQFTLISQNVDNLHQRAGSQRLISMHGQLQSALCPASGQAIDWTGPLNLGDKCNCCQPSNQLRPDIVWFGEVPYYMGECMEALENADLFVAIGTSGQVYPAAGFVDAANAAGARTVELNLEKTSHDFDEAIEGSAAEVVPDFFENLLA
ncbi:NAD-dependent deacylase [Marinospirillum insulare]|uniref:NAD-dependent protein deacylase n=1 Tax=Marinospirillum insulare TaxID=217169 RepID=A0ABQ6A1S6_9GAMM|nr:NAD-dependent deacylase [Marinospirillum insulare]GLR65220.1 NAD-dependent protein deacylase [Marinospirillum insulare]